jgi:hypothetical protein
VDGGAEAPFEGRAEGGGGQGAEGSAGGGTGASVEERAGGCVQGVIGPRARAPAEGAVWAVASVWNDATVASEKVGVGRGVAGVVGDPSRHGMRGCDGGAGGG